ncbi:MAG: hypothetical protein K2X82_29830 [Gemmataceae bacterium]|nr:hypothetical protein [Gemmataceae bacterium]
MATPLEQLDLMRDLRPNWDGYGADPTDPAVIEVAKEFVRLLAALRPGDPYKDVFVSPGRAGGVLIEWADARAEHELEIEPDGTWGFLHTDRSTGQMTERRLRPTGQVVHPGVLQELRELAA